MIFQHFFKNIFYSFLAPFALYGFFCFFVFFGFLGFLGSFSDPFFGGDVAVAVAGEQTLLEQKTKLKNALDTVSQQLKDAQDNHKKTNQEVERLQTMNSVNDQVKKAAADKNTAALQHLTKMESEYRTAENNFKKFSSENFNQLTEPKSSSTLTAEGSDSRSEKSKVSSTINPDSISKAGDEYKFGKNTIGKAGRQLAETIPNCGTEKGQEACKKSTEELQGLSNWSDYADYASYAAVAGTILPAIMAQGNQQKDQERAATIQSISGVANLAAGAVDVGIGYKARYGHAKNLEKVKREEQATCYAYQDENVGLLNESSERTNCTTKFNKGKKMDEAIDQIKSASTTHFIVGGLKAVGGVAALKLAADARENAQQLATLQEQKPATAQVVAAPANFVSTSSGASANTLGFTPVDTTGVSATNTPAPRALTAASSSGASVAPRFSSVSTRRSSVGSIAGGKNSGRSPAQNSSVNDGTKIEESIEELQANKEETSEWSGGGGALNRGGMELGGSDDGIANILGSVTSGLFGGGNNTTSNDPYAGLVRQTASNDGAANAAEMGNDGNGQDKNLFERISSAIDRQIANGRIAGGSQDIRQI